MIPSSNKILREDFEIKFHLTPVLAPRKKMILISRINNNVFKH